MVRLQIEQHLRAEGIEFHLDGDLDVTTCPLLRERLYGHIRETRAPAVVLNMRGVDYVDATALGVLLSAVKQAEEKDGSLSVVSPSRRVRALLIAAGIPGVAPLPCETPS